MRSGKAVGVVGASARAAVMSLGRAGYSAWAVDLFTDRDLRQFVPCARCPAADYPSALSDLAASFPPGPVIYTGGVENAPGVVGELSRRRPVWGNSPEVLARVRDPFVQADVFTRQNLPFPSLLRPGTRVPTAGRWLRKSYRSTGGCGVWPVRPGELIAAHCYGQELIDGPPMSAQFVSSGGRTTLLGITDQLTGEAWLHAGPFAYCGTIGPVPVSDELRTTLTRLGEVVGAWAGLGGLWGADFVLRDGREPYLVDLNPRYTAAMEVLEFASGCALISAHAAAFGSPPSEPTRGSESAAPLVSPEMAGRAETVVGKAVYFAPDSIVFPAQGPWETDLVGDFNPWRFPGFADIPPPAEVIPAGSPVLSFFVADSTPAGCRAKLERQAGELDRLLCPAGIHSTATGG